MASPNDSRHLCSLEPVWGCCLENLLRNGTLGGKYLPKASLTSLKRHPVLIKVIGVTHDRLICACLFNKVTPPPPPHPPSTFPRPTKNWNTGANFNLKKRKKKKKRRRKIRLRKWFGIIYFTPFFFSFLFLYIWSKAVSALLLVFLTQVSTYRFLQYLHKRDHWNYNWQGTVACQMEVWVHFQRKCVAKLTFNHWSVLKHKKKMNR